MEEKETIESKVLDYCQELVMLNYLYEKKMLTKNEMLTIRRCIKKKYGMRNSLFV